MKAPDGNFYFISIIATDEVIPQALMRWDFPNEQTSKDFFKTYTEDYGFVSEMKKYQIALLKNIDGQLFVADRKFIDKLPMKPEHQRIG